MYPGKCGYNCETGGLMENLRSLTVEKSNLKQNEQTKQANKQSKKKKK